MLAIVHVSLAGAGRAAAAASTATAAVSVPLIVSDIAPRSSSVEGGATITVSGEGFSPNAAEGRVSICGAPCTILSANTTQLTCETARLAANDVADAALSLAADGAQWDENELGGTGSSERLLVATAQGDDEWDQAELDLLTNATSVTPNGWGYSIKLVAPKKAAFLRFRGVQIPAGVEIVGAELEFQQYRKL